MGPASIGTPNEEDQRSRAIDLFRYLRAVTELRLRQTLDVDGWEQVIWLHDLAAPSNCLTRLEHDDLDDWIRVDRPAAPPPPPHPPPLLQPWVDLEEIDDWRGAPELRRVSPPEPVSSATRSAETAQGEHSEVPPDILNSWSSYEDRWLDWAATREAIEPDHDIYRRFFRVFNRAEQLGEQFEVVVAVGLLSWRLPGGTIRRHLITTPASLTYDTDSGQISVAPPGVGNQQMSLEDEMVPAGSRPTHVSDEIRDALDESNGPFDDSVAIALRRWVLAADESGVFSRAPEPPNGATQTPEVRFAPAVILRRRLQGSLRRTYSEIITQLTDGDAIPPTVGSLVNDTAATQRDIGTDGDTPSFGFEMPARLFFPLPTNPQQRRIVEELGRRHGVVVQGPPGTGKSHTIANLISHCLATGKRVLVTSHTERALRVVKDKLPDDLRDLTVSVLGAGREGASDLQKSANALLGRRSDPDYTIENLDTEIERLTNRVQELEGERDTHGERLARLRAAASSAHQLRSGYDGPIGEIARKLAAEREAHGWLPDRVSGPMPIQYDELVELPDLADQVQSFEPNLAAYVLPAPQTLPTTETLRGVMRARADADYLLRSADGDREAAERLRRSPIDLAHVAELLQRHDDAVQAAHRRTDSWLDEAMTDWNAGRTNTWEELRRLTTAYLERQFEHSYASTAPRILELGELRVLQESARELVDHLEAGGKLTGLLGRRPRAVKKNRQVTEIAKVLGVPLHNLSTARALRALLEELQQLGELAEHWGRHVGPLPETLAQVKGLLLDHRETLDHLAAITDARSCLSDVVGRVFHDTIDTAADVTHVRGALHLAEALAARDQADAEHRDVRETLVSIAHTDSHPTFRELFRAAEDLQVDQYAGFRAEIERLFSQQEDLRRFRTLRDSLSAAAPRLAASLVAGQAEVPDSDRLDRAWRWSWASYEIEQVRDRSESKLIDELHRAEEGIATHITHLTARRAWRNTLAGMTEFEATELKAYQQDLRLLGKGLGKQAATHRNDAQQHLANCQTAVRAWIMPTYRVAETLRARPESFDVVIVDEASQSGVDALFLFWLGKQMVIVGDDNQISPSNVGVRVDDVTALRQQYLGSLGLAGLLGIGNSLFDQAKVRYSGEVWLTEHFRCMPEIIEFSNQLLYAPQHRRLEPLRQFGNDRLRPLKRRFVPQGEREGSASRVINRAEARELVDVLIQCHNDPRYVGMTFGVIGLLGMQAELIEAELLQRLPNEAWEERQIRCGDSYDFQGDERNVIFLSMVTSLEPHRNRIPKLGNRSDEQRYNVAASRARDQLWLFHSMTPEQLNPECVRYKLLNHFLAPPEADIAPFEDPVSRDSEHPAFDSLFEQRVFLDIRERGYVVRPQVEAYGYRIDIVVAGSNRKLAVECDGAAWHGPEQYAKDLARQRDLERAGWTFFRIRDHDYYMDPENELTPLWNLLQELGIHPRGMGADSAEVADPPSQPQPPASPSDVNEPPGEEGTNPSKPPRPTPMAREAVGVARSDPPTATPRLGGEPITSGSPGAARRVPAESLAPDEVEVNDQERTLWDWTEQLPPTHPADAEPEPNTLGSGPAVDRLGHLLDIPESLQDRHGIPQHDEPAEPEPYTAWESKPVSSLLQLSKGELTELLLEIIAVEGPVIAERVYQLANRAAGATRLGKNIRSALNSAITSAIRRNLAIQSDPLGSGGLLYTTLRLPHQPAVAVRVRGPRESLQHIPPEELRKVLLDVSHRTRSTEERYRAVLECYGFKRLTQNTWDYLHRCEQIVDSGPQE